MNQTPATNIFNQTVFDEMPSNLKKIVEIGTGSGALANAYKQVNPNTKYIGVEIDSGYADLSKQYCDKVYLENFESPSWDLINELSDADLVIFSDVLEHMYDPWKVLDRLAKSLSKNSSVIASIPNTQHWSLQKEILTGNFNYTDSGLLDRTHIRYFTRKTILTLFSEHGFLISKITPRIFDFSSQNEHLEWIKGSAELFDLDIQEVILDSATFQFVITAIPNKD
jgi:2-polyprenyl-3-methyl-5-hydroxy-6-metoxy-1,4-benzoquinol methylase